MGDELSSFSAGLLFSVLFCINYLTDHVFAANEWAYRSSAVAAYSSNDFNQFITTKPHLVMFYAPWCGHCQRLSAVYDKLAEKYNDELKKNRVVIAKVDCTVETALCSENNVLSYPTILFFWSDQKVSAKYKGKRDLPSLEEFVEKKLLDGPTKQEEESLGDYVQKVKEVPRELTDETFESHIAVGYHFIKFYAPWCTHCIQLAPTWDELAETFQDDNSISIVSVDCVKFSDVCKKYSIRGFPSLVFFGKGKRIAEFRGARNHESLVEFVTQIKTDQDKLENLRIIDSIPSSHYTQSDSILVLNEASFEKKIGKGYTFVNFFQQGCEICENLEPVWNEMADVFLSIKENSVVTFANVDCSRENDLCRRYGIEYFPTLILYRNGVRLGVYRGPHDLPSIHVFILQGINDPESLQTKRHEDL